MSSLFGELSIDNEVYEDRLGWAEIVVVGADSDLPAESPSGVLTNYPTGEVSEVRTGVAQLTGEAAVVGSSDSPTIVERVGSGLREGPWFLALLAALGLGTGHALAPGHGKTLMAAYLVGKRGGVPQAVLLGLTVAIAHTIGVGVLGLMTAVTTSQFRPESVYPWLSALAAAIVTVIGLRMLYRALRDKRSGVRDQGSDHDHGHEHSHDHGHRHDHGHDTATRMVMSRPGWMAVAGDARASRRVRSFRLGGGLAARCHQPRRAVVGPDLGGRLWDRDGRDPRGGRTGGGSGDPLWAQTRLRLPLASRAVRALIGGVVVTLIGCGLLLQAASDKYLNIQIGLDKLTAM